MSAQQFLLLSLILYGAGAIAALASSQQFAHRIAGLAAFFGGLAGLACAGLVLANGESFSIETSGFFPFARFVIRCDALSAFMVAAISLLASTTSLYSLSYLDHYAQKGTGAIGFFTNLFIVSMLLVVTVGSAFYFLVFWELMTLASYFLVSFEQERESINAGYIYFLMAHAGTALILIAFFLFYYFTDSFDFTSFRPETLPPLAKDIVFLLAFFGFGVKAGIVPLHIWLPRAHPVAPSNISALLSGIMIKLAIYGIIRVGVDFLGATMWWWGVVVVVFGALSAVVGVLYAVAERDLKKLLAYSSVENVGIILMGIGVGMVGLAVKSPILAGIGFLAGLYHLLNHSVFKGLLFLGAGSVVYRLNTRNMEQMGGLAKRMPWTALLFLTGALAVSALPPLNGFVSEWFTYQSLFLASNIDQAVVRAVAPLSMAMLALTGALAAMCFVKAYGLTFAGIQKAKAAERAREVPPTMLLGMAILAITAILLGIGAPIAAPLVGRVAAAISNTPPIPVANGLIVFPTDAAQATLSTPIVAVLLVVFMGVPLLILALYGGGLKKRMDATPWACGYGYSARMSITANAFGQPLRVFMRPLYAARTALNAPGVVVAAYWKRAVALAFRTESLWENYVTLPTAQGAQSLGRRFQVLQMGDIRVYCLYIVVTLALLLIATVR